MNETPFFFARGDARLFGVLHTPTAPDSRSGFVLSHPFAEEKLWSHRALVSTARALAEQGHTVLRFDYTGAGDSSGTTLDTTVDSHVADLTAAIATLAAKAPALETVGLIGLRLGATVAALVMERLAESGLPGSMRAGPLVLWEPIVDGAAYLQDVMRSNLSAQLATFGKVVETREAMQERIMAGGSVNVDGYEIGRALFDSANHKELLPARSKLFAGPTLIAAIAPAGKQKPRKDLEALAATYGSANLVPVDEQPFWREIKLFYGRAERLQQTTLDWLGRAHG